MSKKKQFVVVGLGRFGETVAVELMRLGHEVLGVDSDEALVTAVADKITRAVTADASNEKVLEELGIRKVDAALVAIGENIEGSILTTLALKSVGVKKVWVKSLNNAHHKIIHKLKVDRILHPEFEMGVRVAQSLDRPEVVDYISLGGNNYIVEIVAGDALEDMTVGELVKKCENRNDLLALRRAGDVTSHPAQGMAIQAGDHLVLMGHIDDLRRLSDRL